MELPEETVGRDRWDNWVEEKFDRWALKRADEVEGAEAVQTVEPGAMVPKKGISRDRRRSISVHTGLDGRGGGDWDGRLGGSGGGGLAAYGCLTGTDFGLE